MKLNKFKAIIWLHILRLWRYKYSAFNMALNTTLWISIFLLGAIMFMPPEKLPMGMPLIFWGITLWTILSNSVFLIGGWTNFYVSMGFIEEHMLTNTSPTHVLVGRAYTGLSVSGMAILLIYIVLSSLLGMGGEIVSDPLLLITGLIIFIIMSISYGLSLSALSFRTGVPGTLLDVSNFILFIIGGIATPVSMLPKPMDIIALLTPYSYPAEIVRYASIGYKPYLPLNITILIGIMYAIAMAITALYLMRRAETYVKLNGVRAIGRM